MSRISSLNISNAKFSEDPARNSIIRADIAYVAATGSPANLRVWLPELKGQKIGVARNEALMQALQNKMAQMKARADEVLAGR